MTCEEVKICLHDFADEQLDDFMKNDVEFHIRKCDGCFAEYRKLQLFFDKLKELPFTFEPPQDILDTFSSQFLENSYKEEQQETIKKQSSQKKILKERQKQETKLKASRSALRKSIASKEILNRSLTLSSIERPFQFDLTKTLLIILPIILIVVGYYIYDLQKNNSPWNLKLIDGTVTINGMANNSGNISQGESLNTDSKSRIIVDVPQMGKLQIDTNTTIVVEKAKDGDNIVLLKRGSFKIINSALMPEFTIRLSNSFVIDHGGVFSISADESDNVKIIIEFGFVEIGYKNQSYFVREGYVCEIKNNYPPGIPYRLNASDTLKNEVEKFNYENGGDDSVQKIISSVHKEDVLTLLALIPNTSQLQRQILFQIVANHYPPPAGVTRMGIIKADSEMLYKWWEEIEWQI
jgi:hypothetical protein